MLASGILPDLFNQQGSTVMRSKYRVSRTLSFDQANDIAYRALSQESSISALSAENGHSRQTIRNERDRVQAIVNQTKHQENVLFYLPVTVTWLGFSLNLMFN